MIADGSQQAKILEIGPLPPPYNGWSTRIAALREEMTKAGYECAILNIGENRATPSDEYECVRSGREYLTKLIGFAKAGYTFHVHTNGESPKAFLLNLISYTVSLVYGRRPVLTFHAGADQVYFPRNKSILMRPILKFLFGFAKAIVCNDAKVKELIAEYGVDREKIVPILPFSRQYLTTKPVDLSAELNAFLDKHSPIVLTYMEYRKEYDLDSLFTVCERFATDNPDYGLVVVGATRERKEIAGLLSKAGLQDRSIHLGGVKRDEFLTLLQRVDVYLRSAKTEGTSSSIREAMHFGVPVVANHAKSHPENVLCYPFGDAQAMYETLTEAMRRGKPADLKSLEEIPDTVSEEVDLLVGCAASGGRPRRQAPRVDVDVEARTAPPFEVH